MLTHSMLLLSLLFTPPLFAKQRTVVHEYRLDNGLRILVKEDHRAPVVLSMVWYKIGSSYEPEGLTGISHALEHMMFKGTPQYPEGQFSKLIAENGGQENAFTAYDYTGYYQLLTADKLSLSMELESDRMRHLNLPEEAFKSELEVVKEERGRRTDNVPTAIAYERFRAAALPANPYQNPVVGWPGDLQNMKVSDLRDWYQTWYAPNNAILVIVGDVKPGAVHKLAAHYFGGLKPFPLPDVKPHPAIKPLGKRTITVNVPAKLPLLLMGYSVPSRMTAEDPQETYALEVLATLLGGSNSSRLEKNVVRGQQIASSMGVGYGLYDRLPTLFEISAVPTPNHTIQDVENAINSEIDKIKNEPMEPDELNRIKAQVIADYIYMQDSVFSQGRILGSLVTVGLPADEADQYAARVQAVTPEQVKQAAKKYLTPRGLTVGTLKPEALPTQGDHHETK